ncbi:DMT family transporter [Clostridiaceae bacterium M8S5]|nr:DMT family transporter [Clostridiaceae bacterium M8S5]
MKTKENKKIYMMMVLAALFWAGAFIGGKVAVVDFKPVSLTFMRFFFASIGIFIILIYKQNDSWKLKTKDLPAIITLGLIGMVGYHILFFTALKYSNASSTSILAGTNPMITMLIACIIGQEKIDTKKIAVLGLALLGVVLTVTKWDINNLLAMKFNKGDIIMMCAVTSWAIYSILVRKFVKQNTPLFLTAYSFLVCTVILLPFSINEGLMSMISTASTKAWAGVLYMSIFPTIIGYLIQQKSIQQIGASRTAIFINLVPVFSIILSIAILKEEFYKLNVISSLLIILSVYMVTRFNKDKK